MNFKELHTFYSNQLSDNILPFWMNNSIDEVEGGFFTCLLRDGSVFDTDKFVWLQARQVWMFSKLYNEWKQNPKYLEIAEHGAAFLNKHGRDENGHWYFSLNQEGEPLVVAYNIFSDCFACMAFGQLYKSTQNEEYAKIALTTFNNILARKDNPKGQYNKNIGSTRSLKNFALPMILCNLTLEIESLLEPKLVESTISTCIHEVMEVFYQEDLGIIIENVKPDGSRSDTMDGRLVNPGHAIEAMWFIMDLGQRANNQALIEKATEIMLSMLEYGWDEKHGGILYFMDVKNHPTQQLEWDQKLWWVHLESLIACLKGYQLTKNEACLKWFERLHEYSWSHFHDAEHGEWFGYLKRDGSRLYDLKGGKWKGCFHVPRGIFQCAKVLEGLSKNN